MVIHLPIFHHTSNVNQFRKIHVNKRILPVKTVVARKKEIQIQPKKSWVALRKSVNIDYPE